MAQVYILAYRVQSGHSPRFGLCGLPVGLVCRLYEENDGWNFGNFDHQHLEIVLCRWIDLIPSSIQAISPSDAQEWE